ncbi:MAG TPA: hypothetical protein VKV95_07860 [Terriglobia bacterium]|nr:hypothetical protein [Terriglobia bacterium]
MFDFPTTGLDQLNDLIEELQSAFSELSGKICEVHFNPSKAEEVQAAIDQTEAAVDERLSDFPDNPLVEQLATGIKEKFKAEILKRANKAGQCLATGGIPFDPRNNWPVL